MEGAVVSASMGVIGPLLAEITILCARLPAGRPKTEMQFFEEKLRSIQEMVSSLHAVKMSHMVEEDTLLKKRWAKQAREIAYDTQDLVDLFRHGAGLSLSDETAPAGVMPKTAGRLKKLRRFSSRPKKPRLDREMVNKVEELKARMAEVIERHKRFKIAMESSSPPKEDMPSCSGHQIQIQIQSEARSPAVSIDAYFSALYAGGDGLVGIDGPREELTALLMDENQHMKVISVLGPEGIGKSTLTKEVFNNIQGKFECCAFVSMSQKTGIQEILQAFLSQFSAQDQDGASIEACQEERLTHKLIQLLKSKRYFVVLDGVSSTRAWRLIRCALPGNNLGSRILMTTCIDDIAMSCCSTTADSIYRMKYLPEVERRRLFMERTFGLEKRCPYWLEEVGSEILRKCGGWPIVILAIASLLASKSSSEEQWKMIQGSIGLALECPRKKKGLALEQSQVRSCDSLQGVKNILYFCYNDLPQHLKTCLLYLSIYPEGYVISRDRLVRRWIAEGFISVRSEHENLEEVGQCYFNELINRGMIQPVGIQYDGRADACQVHNLILSLIVSICAEENFVTLFDGQAHELGTTDKVRRLSLNYHGQKHFALPSTITASPIRSLTLFGSAQGAPILSNNRVLRVLDLDVQGDPGKKYLGTVGSFFQLKYLGLQMSGVVDLPEQIGELQFLETLDLTKSSIRKLPRSILRLWRLVYLLACNVELPDGVGDMQSLEELSGIQVNTTNSTNSLLGVGQLTKLRIVQLIWSISDVCGDIKGYEDNLLSSLKELSKLQSLSIESKDGSSLNFLDSWSPHPQSLQKLYLSGGYYFPRIPERIISLVNLDFLDIRVYQVEDEIMNVLGSLPALLVLSLSSQVAAPEQRIVVQPGLFHYLTKFTLTCLNSWTGLVTEPEALPKLARLGLLCYVQGQRDPVCGDYGIKYLCSLKNLHVEITLGGAGIWEVATRSPESPPPQVQISDEHHMVEEAEIIEVVESLSTHIEEESTIYKDAKMLPKPPTYDFKSWDPQHIVGVHVEMDSQSSQEGPEEVQGIRDVRRWENAIDVVRKANLQRDDPLNLAEKIVRNLENATEDLDAKGNDVRREIVDAERQQRTPTNEVNRWLQKVDNIIRDVQVISHDCRQLKKDVTILASEKLREVQECLSSCPSTVAIEAMPPPVQEMPGPSMSAENHNLQDALHFIKDEPRVGMIGIWGPGGVGKTHLLKNINNSFGEGMTFDLVIFVTASRGCSVEKVQSQIIERFQLQSTGSKSHTIHEYMKTKSFLVLLDDLWDKIDLEDVGIPYPLGNVNKLNRKVVLTTRLRKVCGQMKVKKELKVAYLQEHEAWQLFEENIGAETLSSPHIEALARELMKELKGLPLALITIGKAMYRKDEYQWETAIQYMQQSCCANDKDPVELGMETNVFKKLKFSYDNLRNKTLRDCFLTCAQWPEDAKIRKVDLVQCWMGLGLVNEQDIESSFRKSYSLIADLTAACLLEDCENSYGSVKVHDVIRDMALWISCDCGENNDKWIVAAPGGRDKKVIILSNKAECISLMYNRIPIRFNLDPIKLRILCLCYNEFDESIIVEAIKNCSSLTYLDLNANNLKMIPEELCSLVKLEHLDLSRNEFGETEVPRSFGKLMNLKFLYLQWSYYGYMRIPAGVISNLKALQVIDLRSDLEESTRSLPEWIFRELGTLPQLKALGIMVRGFAQFKSLLGEAVNLPIRYLSLWDELGAFTRILSTDFAQRTLYELAIKEEDNTQQITVSYDTEQPNSHFGALNHLRLSMMRSLREIKWMGATPAFIFPRLTCLELFFCPCLLHLSWVMYLPRLEQLSIHSCSGMVQAFMRCHGDKLCNGHDKTKTFPCLKLLRLTGNHSLETIGDNGMEFPSLERLMVGPSPKLKRLPFQLDSLPLKLKELRFVDAQDWERLECEEGVKTFLQPALKLGW